MARRAIDWDAIEVQYRAGIRSLKDIGNEFGVSDAGILKRAKKDGWDRDLSERIRLKAEAKVSALAVSAEVSAERKATEQEVVEANASLQASKIESHRRDLQELRDKAVRYTKELDACGEDLAKRVSILKALADTQKTLIGLERQAFGIADNAEGETKKEEGTESLIELARKVAFTVALGLKSSQNQ